MPKEIQYCDEGSELFDRQLSCDHLFIDVFGWRDGERCIICGAKRINITVWEKKPKKDLVYDTEKYRTTFEVPEPLLIVDEVTGERWSKMDEELDATIEKIKELKRKVSE